MKKIKNKGAERLSVEEEHPPQQSTQGNIKLLQNGQIRKLIQTYFAPSPTLWGGKHRLKQICGFLPTDQERGELIETKQCDWSGSPRALGTDQTPFPNQRNFFISRRHRSVLRIPPSGTPVLYICIHTHTRSLVFPSSTLAQNPLR